MMEGVRAMSDTGSALTWSLMKVKGDDWLAWTEAGKVSCGNIFKPDLCL